MRSNLLKSLFVLQTEGTNFLRDFCLSQTSWFLRQEESCFGSSQHFILYPLYLNLLFFGFILGWHEYFKFKWRHFNSFISLITVRHRAMEWHCRNGMQSLQRNAIAVEHNHKLLDLTQTEFNPEVWVPPHILMEAEVCHVRVFSSSPCWPALRGQRWKPALFRF